MTTSIPLHKLLKYNSIVERIRQGVLWEKACVLDRGWCDEVGEGVHSFLEGICILLCKVY